MSLLERIARSNGNPQRTIAALRLLNQALKRDLVYLTTDLLATCNEAKRNQRHNIVPAIIGSEPADAKRTAEIW